jgi:protein-S-isoprenylcysteine O-methyltransferase Ste14
MPTILAAIIVVAYASLLLELTLLHVPSVASSLNIWSRPTALVASYSPTYRGIFSLSRPRKVVLFGLPLLVTYGVFLYPLVVLWGPHDPFGDHVFTTVTASNAVAAALVVAGRLITLGSVLAMRARDRGASHLETSGPFRHSRNPGLVGMYVFVAGLWVAAPSLAMLIGIGIYLVHMDFKVRMEEDFLRNRFGEVYVGYQRRTSRYWP